MKSYSILFFTFITLLFSSCRKDQGATISSDPNVINGCEITQSQIVTTNLVSHQVHTYINNYQYDSLGRLTYAGDGYGHDTSHYHYHDNDCDDDNHGSWHSSSNGYTISSISPKGSYQYSYDGDGYLQLLIYIDSASQGHDDSYTESFYWDNGNLSYSIKQFSFQTVPVMTSYTYYTDKANQVLIPTSVHLGKRSKNLLQHQISTAGNMIVSEYSFTYTFDGTGKVAQYTQVNQSHQQSVFTLIYTCH